MTISYSDHSPLTCPRCGQEFEATVWLVLDAQERPDLVAALRENQLNMVSCPHCGNAGAAEAPLLYHDASARRLVFAAPEGAREFEQREMVRELHTLLLENIPEDQQQQYLGDIQITVGLDGLRSILEKDARRARNRGRSTSATATTASEVAPPEPVRQVEAAPSALPAEPAAAELPAFLVGTHELLAANERREIDQVLARYPELLAPDADYLLAQFADSAVIQREHELAEALREARRLLKGLRTGELQPAPEEQATVADVLLEQPVEALLAEAVAEESFNALLQSYSEQALLEATRRYPALLEAGADTWLAARVEAALDLGDERVAQLIEERREALVALRARLAASDTLLEAVRALLGAEDQDAMAVVIDEYPALLTEEAQQALFNIASEARASGDEESAQAAVEYRALLREIRDGLA